MTSNFQIAIFCVLLLFLFALGSLLAVSDQMFLLLFKLASSIAVPYFSKLSLSLNDAFQVIWAKR